MDGVPSGPQKFRRSSRLRRDPVRKKMMRDPDQPGIVIEAIDPLELN